MFGLISLNHRFDAWWGKLLICRIIAGINLLLIGCDFFVFRFGRICCDYGFRFILSFGFVLYS